MCLLFLVIIYMQNEILIKRLRPNISDIVMCFKTFCFYSVKLLPVKSSYYIIFYSAHCTTSKILISNIFLNKI